MKVCPRCSETYPDDAGFCPEDGQELKKSSDPYLGRTIAARYRLTKRLGAGGMSIVYLARHVIIDRLSAIKILREDLGSNPQHRERFLREARAVNRINHRNIVEITDVGESDGVAYLVMEYVSGESLLVHIQRGPLEWPRAAGFAHQMASALARAHQTGIIHRDLKPENIMIVPVEGGGEMVKIMDFGIAKILDAPALTFSEQLFGTPGYIAPEYVEGFPSDYRSDLYSLGVVLYEMLSGTLPFDARGQADLLLKPLTQPPIPLGQKVKGLPPELEALTMQLLEAKPEKRPHDAFAVVEVLGDVLKRHAGYDPVPRLTPPPPPREVMHTVVEPVMDIDPASLIPEPPPSALVPLPAEPADEPAPHTPNVGKAITREIAQRWSAALVELRASIERARARGGKYAERADRAEQLAQLAADLVPRVERAARTVAELQGRVERLEIVGREFRASLGFAIDQLSRDRSHHHTQLDGLRARGEIAEVQRVEAIERDLTFQIDTLQLQLDLKNEQHGRDMVEASGQLEGALTALKHLSNDLVRTLDEAIGIVAGGPPRQPQ